MILLDTHAWVWANTAPDRLSGDAQRAVRTADSIGICPISFWEVAMLAARGRLDLYRPVTEWIHDALSRPRVEVLPITPEIAAEAGGFADLHGDPADRLIAATATVHASALSRKTTACRPSRRCGPSGKRAP